MQHYYILVSYDNGVSFNVLDTSPNDLKECKRKIAWQNWRNGEIVHICEASPILGGRFLCIESGKYIKPDIGVYTLKAWGNFLHNLFGKD